MPIGSMTTDLKALDVLNLLPDAALLANTSFEVQWMNDAAEQLLDDVAPYYGLTSSKDMLNKSMDVFHRRPTYNQSIMNQLDDKHRVRITLAESIHTDIVIMPLDCPVHGRQGFLILLADVTTKTAEELEQQRLIRLLSTPIMKVWENAMALPLIGNFDIQRFDRMVIDVLEECTRNRYRYVLLDVSKVDLTEGNEAIQLFQKLVDSLRLIGAQCILVGVTPDLAIHMSGLDRSILIFSSTYDGIRHVIAHSE